MINMKTVINQKNAHAKFLTGAFFIAKSFIFYAVEILLDSAFNW